MWGSPLSSANPIVLDRTGAVPVFRKFTGLSGAALTLALLTDVAYWQTSNLMWQNFSSWLLLAGNVAGGLAIVVAVIELVARPLVRRRWGGLGWAVCALVALVLAIVNSFVHAGDGWTAVVPYGLALSAATVLILLVGTALEISTSTRSREVVRT